MSDVRNADPTRDDVPAIDRRCPRLMEATLRFECSTTTEQALAMLQTEIEVAMRNFSDVFHEVEVTRVEELPDEPF